MAFIDPFLALDNIKKYHEQYGLVIIDYIMLDMAGYEIACKIAEMDLLI